MSDSGLKSESSLGYSAAFPTAGTKRKLVSESSGPNVKAKTATFTRSSSLVKLESGVDGSSDKDLHKTVSLLTGVSTQSADSKFIVTGGPDEQRTSGSTLSRTHSASMPSSMAVPSKDGHLPLPGFYMRLLETFECMDQASFAVLSRDKTLPMWFSSLRKDVHDIHQRTLRVDDLSYFAALIPDMYSIEPMTRYGVTDVRLVPLIIGSRPEYPDAHDVLGHLTMQRPLRLQLFKARLLYLVHQYHLGFLQGVLKQKVETETQKNAFRVAKGFEKKAVASVRILKRFCCVTMGPEYVQTYRKQLEEAQRLTTSVIPEEPTQETDQTTDKSNEDSKVTSTESAATEAPAAPVPSTPSRGRSRAASTAQASPASSPARARTDMPQTPKTAVTQRVSDVAVPTTPTTSRAAPASAASTPASTPSSALPPLSPFSGTMDKPLESGPWLSASYAYNATRYQNGVAAAQKALMASTAAAPGTPRSTAPSSPARLPLPAPRRADAPAGPLSGGSLVGMLAASADAGPKSATRAATPTTPRGSRPVASLLPTTPTASASAALTATALDATPSLSLSASAPAAPASCLPPVPLKMHHFAFALPQVPCPPAVTLTIYKAARAQSPVKHLIRAAQAWEAVLSDSETDGEAEAEVEAGAKARDAPLAPTLLPTPIKTEAETSASAPDTDGPVLIGGTTPARSRASRVTDADITLSPASPPGPAPVARRTRAGARAKATTAKPADSAASPDARRSRASTRAGAKKTTSVSLKTDADETVQSGTTASAAVSASPVSVLITSDLHADVRRREELEQQQQQQQQQQSAAATSPASGRASQSPRSRSRKPLNNAVEVVRSKLSSLDRFVIRTPRAAAGSAAALADAEAVYDTLATKGGFTVLTVSGSTVTAASGDMPPLESVDDEEDTRAKVSAATASDKSGTSTPETADVDADTGVPSAASSAQQLPGGPSQSLDDASTPTAATASPSQSPLRADSRSRSASPQRVPSNPRLRSPPRRQSAARPNRAADDDSAPAPMPHTPARALFPPLSPTQAPSTPQARVPASSASLASPIRSLLASDPVKQSPASLLDSVSVSTAHVPSLLPATVLTPTKQRPSLSQSASQSPRRTPTLFTLPRTPSAAAEGDSDSESDLRCLSQEVVARLQQKSAERHLFTDAGGHEARSKLVLVANLGRILTCTRAHVAQQQDRPRGGMAGFPLQSLTKYLVSRATVADYTEQHYVGSIEALAELLPAVLKVVQVESTQRRIVRIDLRADLSAAHKLLEDLRMQQERELARVERQARQESRSVPGTPRQGAGTPGRGEGEGRKDGGASALPPKVHAPHRDAGRLPRGLLDGAAGSDNVRNTQGTVPVKSLLCGDEDECKEDDEDVGRAGRRVMRGRR